MATAPAAYNGVVELLHEISLQLCALNVILGVIGRKGNNSTVLLVHKSAQTGLALDDAEGDIHLAAQSGQPDDKLDGVNIVRDHNHGCLLLLDKSGHMLQAILEDSGGRSGSGILSLSGSSGGLLQALNLGFLGLGLVLDQQLEELSSLVLVQSGGELLDGRRNLQALQQDLREGK